MQHLTIHDLGQGGAGIGRLACGQVVFVADALPGDQVLVRLQASRRRPQRADLVQLVQPSPDRVDSPCQIAACGGCALQRLAPARQRTLKETTLLQALRRIGGIDARAQLQPLAADAPALGWGSRHRVRLHASWDAGAWDLGLHQRNSHRPVPLTGCPILWPELEAQVRQVRAWARTLPRACALREVRLAYSRRLGRGAAHVRADGALAPWHALPEPLAATGLAGLQVDVAADTWTVGDLLLHYDHPAADAFVLGHRPDQFTQASPEANARLLAHVCTAVAPERGLRVLELHAGIGNFTLPLARAGACVTAVERDRSAAVQNRANLAAAGLPAQVLAQDDAAAMQRLQDADLVLLDPPRTGARAVAEALATCQVPRVVYVACDPATLARDLKILCAGGYVLQQLHALDMFPQTPHVEAVALLTRPP